MNSELSASSPADSQHSDIPLPAYLLKRQDGVFIDPSRIPADSDFPVFVEKLFSHDARFAGLDYDCFQRLLYDAASFAGQSAEVKLAADIVVFPAQRKELYKAVQLLDNGARAEYMFEPAFLEVAYQEPVYGDADENGIAPILEYRQQTKMEPTTMDFDEFVAAMWVKGVRFGINAQAVKRAIEANKTDRVVIALQREPIAGRDAELQEICEGLRQDNSPLIQASGKADLKRFKNRFPQIAENQQMMKKIPCQFGEPGYKVSGERVEPALPKDIDLKMLAGPGARIEVTGEGEFILAATGGFLSIDVESNQISITDKIEHKEGVSAKTTGDLILSVDEFIEHGEVQEGRIVQGRHIKFTAAVYGTLLSDAGRIELEDNISGGCAKSPGGSVTVKKRASNSTLEALGGQIDVAYAENCTIIGREVTIGRAVNCDILAEEVHMELAEGCSIAARSIEIATANARNEMETIVTVLVPDFSDFDRQTAGLQQVITELRSAIEAKSGELDKVRSDPEFAKFLSIRAMVRDGSVNLSPEQQQNFRQMIVNFTPHIKMMEKLSGEKQAMVQLLEGSEQDLAQLRKEQEAGVGGRRCRIAEVTGDTTVQRLQTNLGVLHFNGLSGKPLQNSLRLYSPAQLRIFSDDHGSVDWQFQMPDAPSQ